MRPKVLKIVLLLTAAATLTACQPTNDEVGKPARTHSSHPSPSTVQPSPTSTSTPIPAGEGPISNDEAEIAIDHSAVDTPYPGGTVVDVKKEYGLKGDGRTDDSVGLQRAMSENAGKDKTLFFSPGVYLTTKTIAERDSNGNPLNRVAIAGLNRDTTEIRLAPNSGQSATLSWCSPVHGRMSAAEKANRADSCGSMDAFDNYLFNITVSIAEGNPKAAPIDYVATNTGMIRNVILRCAPGSGNAGLRATRLGVGPAMVSNVKIEGCDVGIDQGTMTTSLTYEHIRCAGQRVTCLRCQGCSIGVRDLKSDNAVPAVINADGKFGANGETLGMVAIVDSVLQGGAPQNAAIVNGGSRTTYSKGGMYVDNVRIVGYRTAILDRGNKIASSAVSDYASTRYGPRSARPAPRIPVEETPQCRDNDVSKWANVKDYGYVRGADSTKAIQRALDSGMPVVIFPQDYYVVTGRLTVSPHVHCIIGMSSRLMIGRNETFDDDRAKQPLFDVVGGASTDSPLVVDRFTLGGTSTGNTRGAVLFRNDTPRPIALQNMTVISAAKDGEMTFYDDTPRAQTAFVEDVAAGNWSILHTKNFYARQLDPEAQFVAGKSMITASSANLWILGLKLEGMRNVLDARNGTMVELIGGNLLPNNVQPTQGCAIQSDQSSLRLSFAVTAFEPRKSYNSVICSTRDGTSSVAKGQDFARRGAGIHVSFFAS
ncbi:glycosyl hydrolase family 28-related protein [Actinoplanes sp. CA-030573]|uniref:glycosyl hydrolase family 28-related protein n=1 Tax=Actinoplanes sp. CA-030573 TaxID=3239898 RepID=UPI003D8A7B83